MGCIIIKYYDIYLHNYLSGSQTRKKEQWAIRFYKNWKAEREISRSALDML